MWAKLQRQVYSHLNGVTVGEVGGYLLLSVLTVSTLFIYFSTLGLSQLIVCGHLQVYVRVGIGQKDGPIKQWSSEQLNLNICGRSGFDMAFLKSNTPPAPLTLI